MIQTIEKSIDRTEIVRYIDGILNRSASARIRNISRLFYGLSGSVPPCSWRLLPVLPDRWGLFRSSAPKTALQAPAHRFLFGNSFERQPAHREPQNILERREPAHGLWTCRSRPPGLGHGGGGEFRSPIPLVGAVRPRPLASRSFSRSLNPVHTDMAPAPWRRPFPLSRLCRSRPLRRERTAGTHFLTSVFRFSGPGVYLPVAVQFFFQNGR